MRFSLIVPIFKVEKFIRRCALSIIGQKFTDFETIFVDDASPDASIEILQRALDEHPEFKNYRILRHDNNKGLPAARNTGLAQAKGEYVVHIDSDDFIDVDMLFEYDKNISKTGADIIWCDFYLTEDISERIMRQPDYDTATDALKAILGGRMKYNVWNKAIRRSLYYDNGIWFPEGHSMGEDMTVIKLFAYASTIAHVAIPLYHYVRLNVNAISLEYSPRNVADIMHNVNDISNFFRHDERKEFTGYINYFKPSVKLPFLVNCNRQRYHLWRSTFTEANGFILCNPYMGLNAKIIQLLAKNRFYLGLCLYNFLIYKLIYRLKYRH